MDNKTKLFPEQVLSNIRKIMADKDIKQVTVADSFNVTVSQCSKILNGKSQLTLQMVSNFARTFGYREIDILTYPERYSRIGPGTQDPEPVEAILQIKLKKDKKDQVLKLIFGENNIEILNR